MLSIHNLTGGDIDGADTILTTAFGANEGRKADLLRYLNLQPDGILLASYYKKPVGVAGVFNYGDWAYIGMVAVHVDWRHMGVGRALMHEAIKRLEKRRVPLVVLDSTEAGKPLYLRLGFVEHGQTGYYEQDAPAPLPEPAVPVEALDPAALPQLLDFDRPIFGADRRRVLEMAYRERPERVLVTRDPAGRISGFICSHKSKLGPWVARSSRDAEALLVATLAANHFEANPWLLIPDHNPAAIDIVTRLGFSLKNSLSHMHRGRAWPAGRPDEIYAKTSLTMG